MEYLYFSLWIFGTVVYVVDLQIIVYTTNLPDCENEIYFSFCSFYPLKALGEDVHRTDETQVLQ